MRILKVLLILLLVLVTVTYGITQLSLRLSGRRTGPELSCPQEVLELSVREPREALLAGVTATDRQDGDLTGQVRILSVSKLITADTARVTYLVFDSDENMDTLSRTIRYTDYRLPRFSVEQPLVYAKNEAIGLLDRLTVTDVIDGDITDSVRVSTLSATSDSEIYTVSLQVTNSLGDTARVTLPVLLLEDTSARPQLRLSRQLVYLNTGDPFNPNSFLVGVTCPDGQGDKTQVQISGQVDTQTPGSYMVYYRYPCNGTTGIAVLTVVVQ